MTEQSIENQWSEIIKFPISNRTKKPRKEGIIMIIDKGLGLEETRDLLNISADYIDYFKLGFGTTALYNSKILLDKINLVRSFNINIYPGDTFFEVAILQNKLKEYLQAVKKNNFTAIEISDGTINLDSKLRTKAIKMANKIGLIVLSEVCKKILNYAHQQVN